MQILVIVPARGGSKGLPNKNILPLNGHPLLSYSVAAGLQTPEITRVICSTDSEKIAKVALKNGTNLKQETLKTGLINEKDYERCLLYTSPSPRD